MILQLELTMEEQEIKELCLVLLVMKHESICHIQFILHTKLQSN